MLALTCPPSRSLHQGQRTFVPWQQVDADRALEQHAAYCTMLQECGVRVRVLEDEPRFPDGVFLEDTAIVLDELAVVTAMGTETRRGEPQRVEPILREYREVVTIPLPASIEGGDVLVRGKTLFIGISPRTDEAGAHALESIVRPLGYQVVFVPVHGCLHLKTACCTLPDGRLLVNSSWLDTAVLKLRISA
jgi:dimethylargininase